MFKQQTENTQFKGDRAIQSKAAPRKPFQQKESLSPLILQNPKLDQLQELQENSTETKSLKKRKKKAQVLNILKKITQKQRDTTPENRETGDTAYQQYRFDQRKQSHQMTLNNTFTNLEVKVHAPVYLLANKGSSPSIKRRQEEKDQPLLSHQRTHTSIQQPYGFNPSITESKQGSLSSTINNSKIITNQIRGGRQSLKPPMQPPESRLIKNNAANLNLPDYQIPKLNPQQTHQSSSQSQQQEQINRNSDFNENIMLPRVSPANKKKIGFHKRSETAMQTPSHEQQQMLANPTLDRQTPSALPKPISQPISNSSLHNFSFHDTSYNSHLMNNEEFISSNGASPSNARLNNMYNAKESIQLAYMTLKVRSSNKKFQTSQYAKAVGAPNLPQQLSRQSQKNYNQIPPSQTPDLVPNKFKNLGSNQQHSISRQISNTSAHQFFKDSETRVATPIIEINDLIVQQPMQTPNMNMKFYKAYQEQGLTPSSQLKLSQSSAATILPQINPRNRISRDLQSAQTTPQHRQQMYQTVNQQQESLKDEGIMPGTQTPQDSMTNQASLYSKKYMKMIHKLIAKNQTTQQQHNKNRNENAFFKSRKILFETNSSGLSQTQVQHFGTLHVNTKHTSGTGLDEVSNFGEVQQPHSTDTGHPQSDQTDITPIFKVHENGDSQSSKEGEEKEEEFSPTNKQISQKQGSPKRQQQPVAQSSDINSKKNSVLCSIQHQTTETIQHEKTPIFEKKLQMIQAQSEYIVGQFEDNNSSDKQSTEISTTPFYYRQSSQANNQSNHNMQPFIQSSIGGSSFKRRMSTGSGAQTGKNQDNQFLQQDTNQFLNPMYIQRKGTIRDSTQRNPLENSLKSSANIKTMKHGNEDGTHSLIKEDSNEEKESSSNSNNDLVVDPQVVPIQQNELFAKKLLKVVPKKHKRQKTAQVKSLYGKFILNFTHEKRYDEDLSTGQLKDQQQLQQTNDGQANAIGEQKQMIDLPNQDDTMKTQRRSLSTSMIKAKKSLDKDKLWLLDSNRFDECIQKMQQDSKERFSQENSDTVIFEKESSSNGTPPNISAKKGKVDRIDLDKVKRSDSKVGMDHLKSAKQKIDLKTYRHQTTTQEQIETPAIETPQMEQYGLESVTPSSNTTSQMIPQSSANLNEEELNQLWDAHQSLIINQIFGNKKNLNEKYQEVMVDLYHRMNVDKQDKLLLYPKFKLPTLDNYISPTYYDTIYMQNFKGPQLEENFVFRL